MDCAAASSPSLNQNETSIDTDCNTIMNTNITDKDITQSKASYQSLDHIDNNIQIVNGYDAENPSFSRSNSLTTPQSANNGNPVSQTQDNNKDSLSDGDENSDVIIDRQIKEIEEDTEINENIDAKGSLQKRKIFLCFFSAYVGIAIVLLSIAYYHLLGRTLVSLLCVLGAVLASPILALFFIAYHNILTPMYQTDFSSSSIMEDQADPGV
ncbi:hypothetical protein TRFO_07215 [Tritrichomonas foetus]|uniref:Uncharacterized protein n=1 Tax=Tritrichomonas foetus TaxID=1144522 RepID=A0A1J4JYL3_9EUKA|nr:hypothetical protein TRFO_07215 [Tritrichomonas foetus]|eukprot:OHT02357.1 hypothetical protein TRFO_07215 [Tritrichomonas foetus]